MKFDWLDNIPLIYGTFCFTLGFILLLATSLGDEFMPPIVPAALGIVGCVLMMLGILKLCSETECCKAWLNDGKMPPIPKMSSVRKPSIPRQLKLPSISKFPKLTGKKKIIEERPVAIDIDVPIYAPKYPTAPARIVHGAIYPSSSKALNAAQKSRSVFYVDVAVQTLPRDSLPSYNSDEISSETGSYYSCSL